MVNYNDLQDLKDKLGAKQRDIAEELARTQKLLEAAEAKLKQAKENLLRGKRDPYRAR